MTSFTRRSLWRPAVIAAAAVAVVIALAMTALNRADTTAGAAAAGQDPASPDPRSPLTLQSTDGRTVTVPGSKPSVLFFMAWWCASCVEEGQALQAIEAEYEDQVEFVAVEVTPDATEQEVAEFQAQVNNPRHPYLVDRRGTLVERYDVTALDTTLVVDPNGKVLARINGDPLDEGELRAFLENALDG